MAGIYLFGGYAKTPNVSFASFNVLAGIIAAFRVPPGRHFGCLGTLAVDDGRCRFGLPPLTPPFFLPERFIHHLPGAIISLLGIVVVDTLELWITFR
jgi:hypothetical protein